MLYNDNMRLSNCIKLRLVTDYINHPLRLIPTALVVAVPCFIRDTAVSDRTFDKTFVFKDLDFICILGCLESLLQTYKLKKQWNGQSFSKDKVDVNVN